MQEMQKNIEEEKALRTIGKWLLGIAGIILAVNLICRLVDAQKSLNYVKVMGERSIYR